MNFRPRTALVRALALTVVWSGAAFALSQGALLSSLEPACTFGICEEADGSPDNACSLGSNAGEWVVVTGFGFSLPPSTTSIDGYLVEAKTVTSNGCAPVLQLHAPALVGDTRTVATPPTSNLCADSAFRSAGGASDTWGTTLTVDDVNDFVGFGVRVNRCTASVTQIDAVRMTVFFTIGTPVCGDGYQTGDEECEDGGTEPGDGCSATCEIEQAIDKDGQACVNVTNKNSVKLVATVGKLATNCVTAASKGDEPDPDACLASDAKGNVAKAAAKVAADDAKHCAGGAPFGYTSAAFAVAAADAGMRALVHDVYGPTLTGVIDTATAGKCQVAVLTSLQKILKIKTTLFRTCKKNGLKSKTQPFLSSADLQTCFDTLIDDAAGKIAKAVTSLQETIEKKCATVTVAAAFPGTCSGAGDATALATCIDRQVECRACRIFNGVDGLARDCDLVDDGTANASCS